ncbi:phytanoyl-CoA dioxygenase family protein [Paraburkholderia sp. ZP32-5]|uniref:phytanoyl-CoA dioxygenase family protein n=1 Tax=Paraburkholderia sp. ZP32-5 TaxID=2883245 RepID=UPI001F2EDB55|nr:phytanoyl-CoA dioxygenase family protein [Paraburkholderia sp. ZP32-5]
MAKRLTASQLEQYDEKGFLYPLDVFSAAQAKNYLDQLEGFEAEQNSAAGVAGNFRPRKGKGFNFKPHLLFRWVDEIAHNPVILDYVEDLIGPDIRLFNLAVWPKNPRDPAYISWHQDSTYFALDPASQVTVWIALADAPVEAGCMEVVPGSHKLGQLHHSEVPSDTILLSRGQTIDVPYDRSRTEFMPVKAGQCSLHDTYLIHASGPNQADFRRVGMAFSYIPASSRCVSDVRMTAMLVRGEDKWGYYDDEPRPQVDYGEAERAAHAHSVGKFQQLIAEQAAKY